MHKLVLICFPQHRRRVDKFATNIRSILHFPAEVRGVRNPVLERVLEAFADILKTNVPHFDDVIVNVAGGDKLLGCAALSTAFTNGLKAFGVDGDVPMMLSILKISYNEMVSKAKIEILRTINEAGGEVGSLKQLSGLSGYGKPHSATMCKALKTAEASPIWA